VSPDQKPKGPGDTHSLEDAAGPEQALVVLEDTGGWGLRRVDLDLVWSRPGLLPHVVWLVPAALITVTSGAAADSAMGAFGLAMALRMAASLSLTLFVVTLLARVRERLGGTRAALPALLARAAALHLLLVMVDASFRSVLFRLPAASVAKLYPALVLLNAFHFWLLVHWLMELALEGRGALGAALQGTQRALRTVAEAARGAGSLPTLARRALTGEGPSPPPALSVTLALLQLWVGVEVTQALGLMILTATLGSGALLGGSAAALVGLTMATVAAPLAIAAFLVPRLGYHGLRQSRLPAPALPPGRVERPVTP